MTIKEVEQILDIPRATVRFYEKEGLIEPKREGNGYRIYTEDDVDRLKKIIILRKVGIAVSEIEDIFDGTKGMPEVLTENITNIKNRMEELKGALIMCQRMKDEHVELSSFDTDNYWNLIGEEEKKGHAFMDIAKDIVQIEKGVVSSYFSWKDSNGKMYDSLPKFIRNVLIAFVLCGCISCFMRREWSVSNFLDGIIGILSIILVEVVIRILMYFRTTGDV